MKLPPLTAQELQPFLCDGTWIAKIATLKPDGTIRITPLGYAILDGAIVFSTWERSDAVANLRRDRRATVLIDKPDHPYQGVHLNGTADISPETLTPQEYGALFGRYLGGPDAGAEYYRTLTGLGLGTRITIRFLPTTTLTWDFGKLS